ncbi:type II toxin-antitoxin system VapC family toxin [Niveispirillum sp. KHB5.9]|uniref:type II toxin-antitoxin system VapC family toxin n=1 Tax=Niveispirillum sp. KHB5.9 TaxID=3400269 RepID=UPI003A8C1586
MRITADTNVLVRAAAMDDPVQSETAIRLLSESELVVVTLPALCEFVWVLTSVYKQPATDIAPIIRRLLMADKVQTDRAAVEAGLAFLEAGGDFSDGVIAHVGATAGGEVFASFDKRAVKLVNRSGHQALDLNKGG